MAHTNKNTFSNQMIQNFLSDESNYQLFVATICDPSKENKNRLNHAFQDFYTEIRLRTYISKVLWRYARDYLAKKKTEQTHYVLKMDQPLVIKEGESSQQTYGEQFADENQFVDKQYEEKGHLLDQIENPELYVALTQLTNKQLHVLHLYFFCNYKHTEIASILNVSQQAVSKTIKQSLFKLRKQLTEGDND